MLVIPIKFCVAGIGGLNHPWSRFDIWTLACGVTANLRCAVSISCLPSYTDRGSGETWLLQHAIFFFRIISSVPLIETKVLVLLLRICGGWVEQALRLNQGRRNRTSLIFIVENYAESSRKNFLFSQTCSQTKHLRSYFNFHMRGKE